MTETKTVYQTKSDGEYVGQIILSEAAGDMSPLDRKWLIPGGCVEVEPPPIPEGKKLFWRDNTWLLEDIPPEAEPEPEPAPTLKERLATLDAEYDYQFSELVKALGLANLDNNAALIAELQTEYLELKVQYQQEREATLNG